MPIFTKPNSFGSYTVRANKMLTVCLYYHQSQNNENMQIKIDLTS